MNINEYIIQVSKRYSSGISKEHSYRGDLENLLRSIFKEVEITNEPVNVTDCGNPDFVITKKKIPIGYIEAKDIGKDLNSKLFSEQFNRYRIALDNLIITDYLWFQFYIEGELIHEIRIGKIEGTKIVPIPENFLRFENLIKEFYSFVGQTIKSPKKLAEMMASKARLLKNILEQALTSDEQSKENTTLRDQYYSIKMILINDLEPKEFADIYAQTLAYGMFAARLHDKTSEHFDRKVAAELIPKSNPFLRKLFQYVAGYDIDERIKTTVDNLADVFRATDITTVLTNFGRSTQSTDPIIHFYETFLYSYDPKLRKSRGVYYTPEPVVKFIVRAVDEVLRNDFLLTDGLADTKKTIIKTEVTGVSVDKGINKGKAIFENKEIHKVQILDPATGTGTFLSEVIKYIYSTKFKNLQGAWSRYVDEELIPRLNGFEILMASYSMAHLKLDMLLQETGYKPIKDNRFNIYLTNTLEEDHPDTGTLFASWLSTEANEANFVKRDTPVMVLIGNPPYSVSSNNKGKWIQEQLEVYKAGLNEKKINLDDDYIKFIRYGHLAIDKNKEGILAYITNNSFLSGVTHRQMRKTLLESFDKIYIVDLHGNIKQNEVGPDGVKEQNVFDISQGVSITIFIKTSNVRSRHATVYHKDMYGAREYKYDELNSNNLSTIDWNIIKPKEPYYFFTNNELSGKAKYEKGFSVNDLFIEKNTGIQTKNDSLTIQYKKNSIMRVLKDIRELSIDELNVRYGLKEGTWQYSSAKNDICSERFNIVPIQFKPFDIRYTALTEKSNGFLGRPRFKTMRHMLGNENLALLVGRQNKSPTIDSFFITQFVSEMKCAERTVQSYHMPLYTYIDGNGDLFEEQKRKPNLNLEIVNQFEKSLGLKFVDEKQESDKLFSPIDILDYIYAILYSNKYREKYKNLLKIDFPRIPYPDNKKKFWDIIQIGKMLRKLHVMESIKIEDCKVSYPLDGENVISRSINNKDWEFSDEDDLLGRIWINDKQYFDNIPFKVWEFYLGGYQPAQRWLKDRLGTKLSYNDIIHYQKMIHAISMTIESMKAIDDLIII